jgi:hypothetical protein
MIAVATDNQAADHLHLDAAETQAAVALDPKDEFVTTVTQTMASSSLADTLFDADFSHTLGDDVDSSLSALEALNTDEPHVGDKTTADFSTRQGATKEEPTFPAAPLHQDDLDLAEIDRKIDEALDLADRMRASRLHADADDLDVPAFLRATMKDLPLD